MLKLYVSVFWEKNADPARQAEFDGMGKHYINKQSMFAIGVSAVALPILGMTPVKTMEALAGAAQGFMRMEGEAHIPHFFSMECLKGGLISIAIGALVYLLVIRTVFLRKKEGGASTYVDAWPKWLDLENLVYRPLIQGVLPFIGIFVCRIGDSLVDGLVVALRKTLYRDRKIPYRTGSLPKVDTAIGKLLDQGAVYLKKQEEHVSYRRKLGIRALERKESRDMIRYSLSYGLQLAGIGMILILVYLLL